MTTAKWWIRGGLLAISAGLFLVSKPARLVTFGASGASGLSGLSGPSGTTNPVPLVNQPLVPSAVAPGGAGFTLTVNGTGFVSGSVVKWNGAALVTTFLNSDQVTAAVPAKNIAGSGTARVNVENPTPGGGRSNVVFLPIASPLSTVAFGPGLTSASGGVASPMASGDFNGDGKPDLVIMDGYTNGLNVLLGNGDGTFGAPLLLRGVKAPVAIATGDFNGDGKLDLAVGTCGNDNLCGKDDEVAIFLGAGDGTFGAPREFKTGDGAWEIATGDLNGDGKLDLIITSSDFTVSVLLGNGDGTFQSAVAYSVGTLPDSIAVGDFNGDGIPDVAVANYCGPSFPCVNPGSVSVLLGNGDGTLQPQVTYATGIGPGGLVTADFNQDGKLDLAIADSNYPNLTGSLGIMLGNGDGTFQPEVEYAAGEFPGGPVIAADFNNDGKLDLLSNTDNGSGYLNTFSLFLGNGDGTFAPLSSFSAQQAEAYVVADFNGDGRLDLVTGSKNGSTFDVVALLQTTVTATPSAIAFGDQPVNTTSPPQTVILTNSGNTDLRITNIAIFGTNRGQFSQTNNCGQTLAAGTSCQISSTFSPKVRGSDTATLYIYDSVKGSPQTVALTGTGTSGSKATNQPAVMLVPSSLTFPTELLGQKSLVQTVTLTNTGNATLNLTSVAITGSDPADFHEATTCGHTLGAGANCTFSLYFQPTKKGNRTASLTLTDNAPGSPQSVPLSGAGTFVKVAPSSINFGSQPVGTTSNPATVTVTNISTNTTVNISQIVIPGTGGSFAETNNCPAGLAPKASCTVSVTFTPISKGAKSATLQIFDNGGGSPQLVALSGTGTSSSKPSDQPAVTLSPTSLTFPTELLGQKSTIQTVTLTNTGNATLNLTMVAITGTNGTDFHEGTTCGKTLAAGASCTFSVYFQPTAKGTRTAGLTITDNAPGSPQSVPLTGVGTIVKVSPTSINFGQVPVGMSSSAQTITVTNTSVNATLNITSITIAGAPGFGQNNNCQPTVAPLASCMISAAFQPQSTGVKKATMSIVDDGGASPQKVHLSGTGT
ncbi:MAG TPA: choice-of-anchor D domain-containing protein [Terriglobia bacterium]|nr:choice-of-anchor D domain-containing protein [Terriglobia bacterium]